MFCALGHKIPDRMPLTLDVGTSAGIDSTYIDIFRQHSGAEDPAEYFDYDIRYLTAPLIATADDFSAYYDEIPPGTTFDEFGVGHVPSEDFPLGLDIHPFYNFNDPRSGDRTVYLDGHGFGGGGIRYPLLLWGHGKSDQSAHGTGDVEQKARRLIETWAPSGGAIVTAAQTMLADVPWENVQTLVDTIREYSRQVCGRL